MKLRPCPFCGSRQVHAGPSPLGGMAVFCWTCTARGALTNTEASAIEAWNERAAVTADRADQVNKSWQKALAKARRKPAPSASPSPTAQAIGEGRIYPCNDCSMMRTKDEGGTTFTVCDNCWVKRHAAAGAGRPVP